MQADSSVLPVRSSAVAVVALINMFLFPAEVDRVLAPDGVLLWVSTLGDATPIYLPPADVRARRSPASGTASPPTPAGAPGSSPRRANRASP